MKNWFEVEFWEKLLDRVSDWVISSGPTLIVILLGSAVVMKIVRTFLRNLTRIVEERVEEDEETYEEKQKRVHTLMSIVESTIKIGMKSIRCLFRIFDEPGPVTVVGT